LPHISLTSDDGRVRPEDVDAIEQLVGDGGIIDGTTGGVLRRLDQLPRMATPSARQLFGWQLYEPEDDHLATPDELIAEEDARRAQRIRRREGKSEDGGTYADLEECQANRVTHESGGGKGTGKAKQLRGQTTDELHEQLLNAADGDARTGRPRPAFVGGRVTHETKDVLDADKTASNGELMDEVGILMQKTGKTKAEIVDLLRRSGETGCFDPEMVDAMPRDPSGSGAVA
jgi:hypothetical protein